MGPCLTLGAIEGFGVVQCLGRVEATLVFVPLDEGAASLLLSFPLERVGDDLRVTASDADHDIAVTVPPDSIYTSVCEVAERLGFDVG